MAEATVRFDLGAESITVHLPVDLPAGETIITGDFGGVVPVGTVARLRGTVRLIDNLHVRGTLLCDPSGVNLDGQDLFDIHTHDGTLNLVGTEKTAWLRWGETPVGWQTGDRLAVAPTKAGVWAHSEMSWSGSWSSMVRPPNSPDVTLVDKTVAKPEVVNLSQTVTLRNLKRVMIHEASAANPQTFKWIRVLNSGEAGVLGMYPIHFHMIGEHARGSWLEGVVVEGGRNHAYVPHASHGITFKGCAAVNTRNDAYWWDPTVQGGQGATDPNRTDDTSYDHCLVLGVTAGLGVSDQRTDGFHLGRGSRNKCNDCVAVGVLGGFLSSGYHWPEAGDGPTSWEFKRDLAHNCKNNGIFTWQNSTIIDHVISDFVAYRCGRSGVEHGAYLNFYKYRRLSLTGCLWGFQNHALSWQHNLPAPGHFLEIEDVQSDTPIFITEHSQPAAARPSYFRRLTAPQIVYDEQNKNPSYIIYEDSGLTPAKFLLTQIHPTSKIEIKEGGVLTHRWAAGSWS